MTSEARTETSCCQAPISFMTYAIDKAHRLSLFSFLVFMSYSIECRLIHVERLYALRHLHLWSLVVSACLKELARPAIRRQQPPPEGSGVSGGGVLAVRLLPQTTRKVHVDEA